MNKSLRQEKKNHKKIEWGKKESTHIFFRQRFDKFNLLSFVTLCTFFFEIVSDDFIFREIRLTSKNQKLANISCTWY